MNQKNKTGFAILFLGICLFTGEGKAQQDFQSRAAQYFLGTEAELLVPVNIWGFVQRPGQYMVPTNTDLIALLSYAGGPTEAAKVSDIKIIRSDMTHGNKVIQVNVKKYLDTADYRLIPELRPQDTIIVKGTTFHWIGKVFEFLGRLSIFAQIYYFIVIAEARR